jgi:hypothetical protein
MHLYPAPVRFLPIVENREMTLPMNAAVLMLSNAIRRLHIKHLDSPMGFQHTRYEYTEYTLETAPT